MKHLVCYKKLLPFGVAALLTACAVSNTSNSGDSKQTHPSRNPELWPSLSSPFYDKQSAELDKKIDALIAQMSVAQKVGQMTQAEISRTTPEDVKKYHLGSVLNGGGGFVNGNKYATADDWLKTLDAYWEASMDTSTGGLAIPITWGTDAVHGHNKIYGATIFPHNIGLGATRNGKLVRDISALTAKQVLATGLDWTFAPAVSVVRNDRWGRTYEGFSESPELVTELGYESILGFQGSLREGSFMDGSRIAATAKHYLADGGTENGVDRGNNNDSEADLIALHGQPYIKAVEGGVQWIMASHSSWQGKRLHGEEYLLNQILKGRLGFEGAVVGDWNSHGLVAGCTDTHCPQAINAGMDLLMVPFDWKPWIENTIKDVEQGRIPMARIDDAVKRILRVKFRTGLMTAPKPSKRPFAGQSHYFNSKDTKALARKAVRESLVLLKNNEQALPLNPKLKVLVAGDGAHNIPMQCGGWTISWQGNDLKNEDFPNGTSVFQAVEKVVTGAGGTATLSPKGNYGSKPDVAIVVYGETPYAEWQGDIRHLGFETSSNKHAKILEQFKADGIKTISVFLTGRPMWANRAINASDAFVAAWLPGTEAQGITDLLFTDKNGAKPFDFTGTLAYSWPRTPQQTEVNVGDADYNPLFPFGYGLNYQSSTELALLPTDTVMGDISDNDDILLFDGRAQDPWEIHLAAEGRTNERYISGIAHQGPLTITEADKETQGDAFNALWRGGESVAVQINFPSANRNFTELLNGNGALIFDIRPLSPPTKPVYVEMACRGGGCNKTAEVDMSTLIKLSPKGDWNELSVSLACFANAGVSFDEIGRAFGIKTAGELELQITNIRLQPGSGDKAGVRCELE